MLDDVTGSTGVFRLFLCLSHVFSVKLHSSVKRTRHQKADLPILVFPGECWSGCMVPGCENKSHWRTWGTHATLMESESVSVSDTVVACWRSFLLGSGIASPVPLSHKAAGTGPAAGLMPPLPPFCSTCVTACKQSSGS